MNKVSKKRDNGKYKKKQTTFLILSKIESIPILIKMNKIAI